MHRCFVKFKNKRKDLQLFGRWLDFDLTVAKATLQIPGETDEMAMALKTRLLIVDR